MTRRTYTSEIRARAARETRAAILRAAGELFAERGYTRTSVAAIAARAGVALNTVYTSVGGKSALIEALAQDGTADEVIDAALSEMLTLTDGVRILQLVAESTGEVTRRQAVTLRVLLDNATSDPAVAAAVDLAVRRYRQRLGRIAVHLVEVGAVSADVARTEQILWFYFGIASWATVRQLGWDWPEAAAWLADQSAAALLLERVRG